MVLKVKPKRFGPVYVFFDGSDLLHYAHVNPRETSPHPPANSPVDTLLAALGSCIVKSVQWVADQQTVSLNSFAVKVVGTKSKDLPGRVEKVDIKIIGQVVDDENHAMHILSRAKSICTVSNSLISEVTLAVEQGGK